jgi:putative transcriptional regulator
MVNATTEADIERHKSEDGMDDATLGPIRVVPGPDVQALRERLGMTQEQFADTFDLPLRTVQGWEQNHRIPSGATRTLLSMIAHDWQSVATLIAQARHAESYAPLTMV